MSNTEWLAFTAAIEAEESKNAARRKFERAAAVEAEAKRRKREAQDQYLQAHNMQRRIAEYMGYEAPIEPVYRDYDRLDRAYARRTGESYDDGLDTWEGAWDTLGKIGAAAKRIINDRSRW